MTLTSLIDRAKAATAKWWKWILTGLIALIALFLAWRLRTRAKELAAHRAEYSALRDFIADLKARATVTNDVNEARELLGQATALEAQLKQRELDLRARQKEYALAKEKVDAAKNWDDLDNLAGKSKPGGPT